jgi:SAM-dependent methyltransferase
MDPKTLTIATYNTNAAAMAARFDSLGVRTEDIEKGLALVDKENPAVLEIGCGHGREAREILNHTDNYRGMDVAEAFIRMARREFPGVRFEVADIDTYEFPVNLDLIFAFTSLLHSDRESVQAILQRAHAALNPGGIFYISLKYGEYAAKMQTDRFGERMFYYYTPELIAELAGPGYAVVEVDRQEYAGSEKFVIVLRKITAQ